MTESNIPGYGNSEFVKTRDLVGSEFNIVSIREGESNFGPSYYLDILKEGKPFVIGAGLATAMGGQITKVGKETFTANPKAPWTVVEVALKEGHTAFLLAAAVVTPSEA